MILALRNLVKSRMGWMDGTGDDADVVLSTRVRLARNLAGRAFPHHAKPAVLEEARREAFAALKSHAPMAKAAQIPLDELGEVDRALLRERHIISHNLEKSPKRRGVVVAADETLSAMVNEEDHLRLQGMGAGLSLKRVHRRVDALDAHLGARLAYAYDERRGFLTACPSNVGTGMRASCLLHLPALGLTGQAARLLEAMAQRGVTVRGLYGEGTRVVGDCYQVSNTASLGSAETALLRGVREAVEFLIARERQALAQLTASARGRIKTEDRAQRSRGILTHARAISFEEAMQHLSNVRLGLTLGFKMDVRAGTLNELLVVTRPAHIQMRARRPLDPAARDVMRAAYIRERLEE